jgi:hypothetical protein
LSKFMQGVVYIGVSPPFKARAARKLNPAVIRLFCLRSL